MFATAMGTVVPRLSGVVRSTSSLDPTLERLGTIKTSLYVRSYAGTSAMNFIALQGYA
jgi:hypothetical protein